MLMSQARQASVTAENKTNAAELLAIRLCTHVELGDVEVGLDRAQLPRLVLQEHSQLLQSGPGEWGGFMGAQKKIKVEGKSYKRMLTSVHI